MEKKKNNSANYSRHRNLFLCLGFCFSISMVYAAFQVRVKYEPTTLPEPDDVFSNYLPNIPITEIEKKEQPEPPKPKLKQKPVVMVDKQVEEMVKEVVQEITKRELPTEPAIWLDTLDLPQNDSVDEPFLILETPASFPGGDKAWAKFLRKNFKYPRKAKRMNIHGKVFLSFYVDAEGNISDIKVTRGIGGGCDEEAIRVLKLSPKWNPGLQRGRAVKSPMSLFIHFVLK